MYMLDKIDVAKKLPDGMSGKERDALAERLGQLQRECKDAGIPVTVVFEGWSAAGKGTLISRLIRPLDPRGFMVYTTQKPGKEELLRPFMWRFWTKTPEKGRIHIFDRSWYSRSVEETPGREIMQLKQHWEEIVDFERQLHDDGTLFIKFFLHIDKKEQKKRFDKLLKKRETAWRVTKKDMKSHKEYEQYAVLYDKMLIATDSSFAPWTIVEATDEDYATDKIMRVTIQRMEEALVQIKRKSEQAKWQESQEETEIFSNSVLAGVNPDMPMSKQEYKKRRKELQARLALLHNQMYKERIPVVLAFEGWDAGGKGGAIKRITENIDPRGYAVIPTASPNDIEKKHHYLWRFWRAMPKAGHMAIFDRTWYGRVMVERIEGFCKKEEWKRAYREINAMEAQLAASGCIVLKFWMHIDKDEQERRFKERENTPNKQWKITEEDWRNRARWEEYEKAVDEMIVKTSTDVAPWIIVPGNSKYYARIKVLETVVNVLEERFGYK